MIVCITEKPSVGRDIAAILGANTRRDGYFEGNGYCVTWTFGHLCTLKSPDDYNPAWKRWSLGSLPMIPQPFGIKVIDDKGIEHQFKVIESLLEKADGVINCGDAGQEGELIQRWVMQKANCKVPVKRLWISSLTDEAIREGFKNLREQKDLDSLYTAALCRAIGDWILGLNATRLYTLKYGQQGQVLSIGRVQTPTLALIVNRQKEIDDFVPTDSWEVRTLYREVNFTAKLPQFPEEEEATAVAERLKAFPLSILSVEKKKRKEFPPKLFDLTSLQVECNKKFGLSADTTLKTIQSLYEKKVTTYPRVDTTYLTEDVYKKCGPILNSLTYFADKLRPLRGKKLLKRKKVFDNSKVTDHHAIIPTGQRLPALTETERKVFDLIATRFIAIFYPDCEFEQTSVIAKVDDTEFKATGKKITAEGWRALYPTQKKIDDAAADGEENLMPEFTKGETGPHTPSVVKRTTQPPKYFTEGTLLKAMETAGNLVDDEDLREALKANGIGRPSTRAAIIEILYKRGYIRKEKNSLRATDAGIELISLISEELLKSARLTGIWENRLRRIEAGDYSAAEFIAHQKELINQITITVLSDNSNRRIVAEQNVAGAKAKKSTTAKGKKSAGKKAESE